MDALYNFSLMFTKCVGYIKLCFLNIFMSLEHSWEHSHCRVKVLSHSAYLSSDSRWLSLSGEKRFGGFVGFFLGERKKRIEDRVYEIQVVAFPLPCRVFFHFLICTFMVCILFNSREQAEAREKSDWFAKQECRQCVFQIWVIFYVLPWFSQS